MTAARARFVSYLMAFSFVGGNALCLILAPNWHDGVGTRMQNLWALSATAFLIGNALWAAYLRKTEALETELKCGDAISLYAQVALIAIVALLQSWIGQPGITLHGGLVGDGQHYHAIYTWFLQGKFDPFPPRFPFYQRIGMPLLAAHLPLEARSAFFLLHAVFWVGTMLLFAFTCLRQFRLRPSSVIWAVLWLQVLWISIPRASAAASFTVDSAALFFIQLWVTLLISRRAFPLLFVCALAGTWFKETGVMIAGLTLAALLLEPLTFSRTEGIQCCAAKAVDFPRLVWVGFAFVAAIIVQHLAGAVLPLPSTVILDSRSSALHTLTVWAMARANEPMDLLRYLACGVTVFGGFALLAIARLGMDRPRALSFAPLLGWLAALYVAVCFFAGSDLSKFAYMSFPILLPLLIQRFEAAPPRLAMAAWALGLLAARPWSVIPFNFPAGHEDPNMDMTGLYSWMPEYAHWGLVACWCCYFIAIVGGLRMCSTTPKPPPACSL